MNPYTQTRSNQGPQWDHIIHYTMNHISMKAGIKIFGTRGVDTVSKKLRNIKLCREFNPIDT